MQREALTRRGLLSTAGTAFAIGATPTMAQAAPAATRTISAAQFGIVGDGVADDTAALQRAIDAVFTPGEAGILIIPPGIYKVSRTLKIEHRAHMGHRNGIVAHGARLVSAIADGSAVVEVTSLGYVRFLFLEGLDIEGNGREGHAIVLRVEDNEHSLYNFCLRDVIVQQAGGDGCHMIGNVFEGQIINSYFRKNRGNGITFSHGRRAGILSCIHVFGCIFGDNSRHGAALVNGAFDVAFYGCYFLENDQFGLVAENGCTLLSDCGFENNHRHVERFEDGDAGILLQKSGTLIGCGAYSQLSQTMLIRARVEHQLVMIGCAGTGDKRARNAGLAKLGGTAAPAAATIIGCRGAIEYADGFEALEIGGPGGGVRFGADWRSRYLPRLGDYRLWVDKQGRLRLKKGVPAADGDGAVVGT
jgi:hypothetical protein